MTAALSDPFSAYYYVHSLAAAAAAPPVLSPAACCTAPTPPVPAPAAALCAFHPAHARSRTNFSARRCTDASQRSCLARWRSQASFHHWSVSLVCLAQPRRKLRADGCAHVGRGGVVGVGSSQIAAWFRRGGSAATASLLRL